MPQQSKQPPTNERIMRALEELKAELRHSGERQAQIARDLARLLERC